MFVNYFLGLRNLVSYSQGKRGCWRCLFGAATCLLDCTRDILVYMNKWGFVYAGLYVSVWAGPRWSLDSIGLSWTIICVLLLLLIILQGYSFFQGGKNVAILFRGKGWKGLITDDLADNIIFILNLAIATVTGFVGWLFSNTEDHYYTLSLMYTHPGSAGFWWVDNSSGMTETLFKKQPKLTVFLCIEHSNYSSCLPQLLPCCSSIGFLVGYLISSVLLGVLGGAVNAIIVCFAESPVEFQRKHPVSCQFILCKHRRKPQLVLITVLESKLIET